MAHKKPCPPLASSRNMSSPAHGCKTPPSLLLLCARLSRSRKLLCSSLAIRVLCGASLNAAEPYRASYYKAGEIHITVLGQPEGKAITTGHWDFKPSWSITGDHLVFFRRLKNDPLVSIWISQLCIINAMPFAPEFIRSPTAPTPTLVPPGLVTARTRPFGIARTARRGAAR